MEPIDLEKIDTLIQYKYNINTKQSILKKMEVYKNSGGMCFFDVKNDSTYIVKLKNDELNNFLAIDIDKEELEKLGLDKLVKIIEVE